MIITFVDNTRNGFQEHGKIYNTGVINAVYIQLYIQHS